MALSNWDTLAINNQGKGCDGTFGNKDVSIDIYKNWVYLRSPKMWHEGMSYVKPTIASINHGNINIGGLQIEARRGPQNAIFVFAYHSYTTPKNKYKHKYFAGIGCYGFYDKIKEYFGWANLPYDKDGDYAVGSSNYDEETCEFAGEGKWFQLIYKYENDSVDTIKVDPDFGELTDWVGVMPSTLEEFKEWLIEVIDDCSPDAKKWFDKIDWKNLTRYNQGDAFFVGADDAQTKVGEQKDDTILGKIIDKL